MSILSPSVNSLFTTERLDVLKTHKVVTSLDFLQCNNDKVAHYMGVTVSDVIKIKEKILDSNGIRPMRVDKLCDLRLQSTSLLATGIIRIDNWLGGGIPTGNITELFGLPSTGKTWLASSLSAHVSFKQNLKVSYLTTSSFYAFELLELMKKLSKEGDSGLKQSLQKVEFTPVLDVYQLMEILWRPAMSSYRLVIVDSLASLFMPILGDSSNDAISLLNKVASDLKRIAVVNRCAVFIVNHEGKQKPGDPTPALGRYWLSVPNLRLHTKRLNQSQIELSIVRNVYCPDVEQKCVVSLPDAEAKRT